MQMVSRLEGEPHVLHTEIESAPTCEPSAATRNDDDFLHDSTRHVERIEVSPATAQRKSPPAGLSGLAGQNPQAMLTFEQQKTMARHKYGALIRELQLSTDETDRLLAVLGEQDSRGPSGVSRDRAGFSRPDATQASRERAEIAGAIGSTKAAAFEQLKATLPARFELRRIRDKLEEAGVPMTPDQHRALIDVVSAQRPADPPGRGDSLEDSVERYRAWVSERDRVLRENAGSILDPSQLKTLDESQALRAAMNPLLGAAMRRANAAAGSGG